MLLARLSSVHIGGSVLSKVVPFFFKKQVLRCHCLTLLRLGFFVIALTTEIERVS